MPSPFTVGSKWQITTNGSVAHPIVVTIATPTQFTAVYVGTPPSIPAYSLVR
jgi:hypothetical protein